MDTRTVGMIGLGLMGTALTERLLEAGYTVWIHNRTREKAAPLEARGAQWADNPLAVCDRVLISLYTTDTVEEVLGQLDDGLRPGQILIDTTTGEPEQTARLGARLAARGVHYLDAPISGSSEQTRRGEATAIEGDFCTQARLSQHLKDIRLILDAAATAGQDLPLTETQRQLLEAAEAAGFGDADNSAIIRAFDRSP